MEWEHGIDEIAGLKDWCGRAEKPSKAKKNTSWIVHGAPLKEDAGREDYDLGFTATREVMSPDGICQLAC